MTSLIRIFLTLSPALGKFLVLNFDSFQHGLRYFGALLVLELQELVYLCIIDSLGYFFNCFFFSDEAVEFLFEVLVIGKMN